MSPTTLPHPRPEELAAFVSGQVPEETATAVSQHLADCETCRTMVDSSPPDTLLSLLRKRAEPACAEANPAAGEKRVISEAVTLEPTAGVAAGDVPAGLADNPRYRVLELLGSGGMGAVYKAEHRRMERHVALKVMSADLMTKPAMVERFHREVKAAARLTHPHIVTAFDADQAGDAHFLVMEFVEGVSLAQQVQQRGRLPMAQACDCIRQAALGLHHAFERGMVHRDIKPHNLMLTPGGQVKILDFGLARFVRETAADKDATSRQPAAAAAPAVAAGGLTQVGTLMGTADFIAPEQVNDPRQADIRADIYSLGCTFYFLLAGRVPFPEGTALDKLMAHTEKTPVALAKLRPDVSAELARVVEKMMAKDPARRYQTPGEAATALTKFTGPPSLLRRLKRPLSAAGFLAAMFLAATVIYIQTDYGEFRVETNDNEIALKINKEGIRIHDRATNREYVLSVEKRSIRPGEYQVKELPDGLEVVGTGIFKLNRGGQATLVVKFKQAGNRDYLVEGLRWFPADTTFLAARDMRVLKELSLQKLIVLTEMAHAPRRADLAFSKLVRDVGTIERVTVAYDADKKQSGKSRLFARLTGSINHERLADVFRHEWPGAVVREQKGSSGETITLVHSSERVRPAFALIGETDLLVAADLSPAENDLEVLKQALDLRSGKAGGLALSRATAEKIPSDALAFFVGQPPEVFKNLFLFPVLPRSILLTIRGTTDTQFHFESQFAGAADADSFVKNLTVLKALGLGLVRTPLFSRSPKASELLTKALNGLEVKVAGDRVSGGYDIPGEGMDALTKVIQKVPLSDVKKLIGGGPPRQGGGPKPDVSKKFGPADRLIGHERITVTPEYGGWRIEAQQPCTIPLFEIANPGVEECVVKYRARLKTHVVQDRVYLEMLCRLPGQGEFFSRGLFNAVAGTTDWADYEIPFYLDKGQRPDLIKLNLVIEGKGNGPFGYLWIKDVEVRREPLPPLSPFTKDLGKRLKAFQPTDKTLTTDRVVRDGAGWRIDSREKEFRTVHLFEVPNPGVDGCLLVYRLQMKTRLLGSAYQEMWCRFPQATDDAPIEGEFFSKGFDRIVSGNTDWTSYLIHFRLEKNQRPDLVKLDLVVGGMGQVWVKNVELVQVPLHP